MESASCEDAEDLRNLDAWILSHQSDRAVRIDMKISDFVAARAAILAGGSGRTAAFGPSMAAVKDMYPKDGLLLNGIATIACARVPRPWLMWSSPDLLCSLRISARRVPLA